MTPESDRMGRQGRVQGWRKDRASMVQRWGKDDARIAAAEYNHLGIRRRAAQGYVPIAGRAAEYREMSILHRESDARYRGEMLVELMLASRARY